MNGKRGGRFENNVTIEVLGFIKKQRKKKKKEGKREKPREGDKRRKNQKGEINKNEGKI